MNTTSTLKPASAPVFTTTPIQVILRFIRFTLRQLTRPANDLAALRYAANKYNGQID